MLQMLGYELPVYRDDAEAWQPPQEYRLPRYVARRNRVVGGLVVALKLHAEAPLPHCTRRFAHAATECYYADRCAALCFQHETLEDGCTTCHECSKPTAT